MVRRKRSGFTLVELLVVISIIGTLVALLLPAVQAAREAARRNTCLNNQHQLSIAVDTYVSAKKFYPGYRTDLATTLSATVPAHAPVSWVVELFPQLERQELYDLWKANPHGIDSSNQDPRVILVQLLICPSDARDTSSGPPLSYVANAGQMDAMPSNTNNPPPGDHAANGVFTSRWEGDPNAPARPIVKTTKDSIIDGTSNTLLLSENLDARYYHDADADYSNKANLGTKITYNDPGYANSPDPKSPERYTTFVWWGRLQPQDLDANSLAPLNALRKINGKPATGSTESLESMSYARPSSNHPGGVNVTWCDGRSGFLSEGIEYGVFCLIMSSNGKKTNPAGIAFDPTLGNSNPYLPLRKKVLDDKDIF